MEASESVTARSRRAHTHRMNEPDESQHDAPPGGGGGLAFGGTVFLEQSAHVAVLDAAGRILAVNAAWDRFGAENGLAPDYAFAGVDYLDVCARAARGERDDRTDGA